MPSFTYTARALNGDLRQATIDAPNRDEVVAQLKRQRLNIVKIDETHRRKLRELGLLTRDARAVERKKPGRPKARKRFQFSKR